MFPKRHQSHVTETASFKRLDQCIPNHWVIRHVSERDYGLDCLIEPVSKPNGPVKGDLLAIQLKGTKSISWITSKNSGNKRTTYGGTKITTVNYWMNLPMPVFLCVHEQISNSVYFASVKHQVRDQFKKFQTQKTFGFKLTKDLDLAATHGIQVLLTLYLRERFYTHFADALTDLLVNWEAYAEYIEGNIERDCFLEVESPELVQLFRLYRHIQTVALFAGLDWNVTPMGILIQEDHDTFKENHTLMHELTHTRVLRELVPVFVETFREGLSLVGEDQRDYWALKEPLLVRYIDELKSGRWIGEVEQRFSLMNS